MQTFLKQGLDSPLSLRFHLKTLEVHSSSLKSNFLKDSDVRNNPLLVPKNLEASTPVVFVLSGFSGNGIKSFNFSGFGNSFVEDLLLNFNTDALFVFVDAWTKVGGSQFINSIATGKYQDYIVNDLYNAVKKTFQLEMLPNNVAIVGGSSGGYGALSLCSQFPEKFAVCGAIAPDCFFQLSLLPELYAAYPYFKEIGSGKALIKKLSDSSFINKRYFHRLINAYAMGLCYSPDIHNDYEINWPFDENGILIQDLWHQWLKHDPCLFLATRKEKIKKIKSIYLSCGTKDQYHLCYGARQLKFIFTQIEKNIEYYEFDGNHFDISKDRPNLWQWLEKQWKNNDLS